MYYMQCMYYILQMSKGKNQSGIILGAQVGAHLPSKGLETTGELMQDLIIQLLYTIPKVRTLGAGVHEHIAAVHTYLSRNCRRTEVESVESSNVQADRALVCMQTDAGTCVGTEPSPLQ